MMRNRVFLALSCTGILALTGCASQPTQATTQPLSPQDIKALAKGGVNDDVIISQIQASRTVYRLSSEEILDLKNSGVSEKVIEYMVNTPSLYQRQTRQIYAPQVPIVPIPSVPDYTMPTGVSPQVVESQIDGDFSGWDGETIVKLTNGQIWQQTEYYYQYHYAFMPHVLVYRSSGGYKMRVDGVDRAVRVERLK